MPSKRPPYEASWAPLQSWLIEVQNSYVYLLSRASVEMHLKNENSHHRRECCHTQGETVVDASEKGFFIMMMDVDMRIIINTRSLWALRARLLVGGPSGRFRPFGPAFGPSGLLTHYPTANTLSNPWIVCQPLSNFGAAVDSVLAAIHLRSSSGQCVSPDYLVTEQEQEEYRILGVRIYILIIYILNSYYIQNICLNN